MAHGWLYEGHTFGASVEICSNCSNVIKDETSISLSVDLDIDHVGRSILKSSELSLDRFDLLSLLLIHNTCLQDFERL